MKEDIEEITAAVEEVKNGFRGELEEVKHTFQQQLEQAAHHNRLRLAALDRRLEVHQEAYALWRKLYLSVHEEERGQVISDCQTWWTTHCLYLNAEVREAFMDAVRAAWLHPILMKTPDRQVRVSMEDNWRTLESCGNVIIKSAGLPGFAVNERKVVGPGGTDDEAGRVPGFSDGSPG